LASKYQSEAHQIRRSMRIVEAAWLANPHPDLADAYAHVRLGDAARQRLVRVETLAQKTPGHPEGALAVARAAIDASEFARARDALAPLIDAPTQRVAMLMAEIERTEHGDSGRARAWTLRAVRALHDPVWTADGYVSDRWRPVSPVTGRLDAFQWQTPLAALPSDRAVTMEAKAFTEAMLAPPRVESRIEPQPVAPPPPATSPPAEPPRELPPEPASAAAAQDNSPIPATPIEHSAALVTPPVAPEPLTITAPSAAPAPVAAASVPLAVDAPTAPPPPPALPPAAPPPLFRPRPDLARNTPNTPPVILPIVRPPDDPGIEEDPLTDEYGERSGPVQGQAGGWRGFLARWGG
jgi:HemY protein